MKENNVYIKQEQDAMKKEQRKRKSTCKFKNIRQWSLKMQQSVDDKVEEISQKVLKKRQMHRKYEIKNKCFPGLISHIQHPIKNSVRRREKKEWKKLSKIHF